MTSPRASSEPASIYAGTAAALSPASRRHWRAPNREQLASLGALASIATVWLIFHGYDGIVHDSQLYLFLALERIAPYDYSHDIFLLATQQADFSLFHPLYSIAIEHLGVERAGIVFYFCGALLWVGGAARLLSRLAHGRTFWVGLLLAAALPSAYGSQIFSYGEGFVTPRLFAEALVLHGLAAALPHVRPTALVLCLIAALLHPLIAAGGLLILIALVLISNLRWLLICGLGVAATTLLALVEVLPFRDLFSSLDPAWLEIVRTRTPKTLLSYWTHQDWAHIVFACSLAVVALPVAGRLLREFIIAVLAVTALAIAASLLLGDLLQSRLIIQLQLWRSLWLLQLLSNFLLGFLSVHALKHNRYGRESTLLLWAGWTLLASFASALVLVALSLTLFYFDAKDRLSERFRFLSAPIWVTTAGVFTLQIAAAIHSWTAIAPLMPSREDIAFAFILFPPLYLLLFLAADFVARKSSDWSSRAIIVSTALLLAVVMPSSWDRRSDWLRFVTQHPFSAVELQSMIPQDATVYWDAGPRETWLLVGRASYMSRLQGAGVLFSQELASEYERRGKALDALSAESFFDFDSRWKELPRLPHTEPSRLRAACESLPDLDYVILPNAVAQLSIAHWHTAVGKPAYQLSDGHLHKRTDHDFYLYDCGLLRPDRAESL